MYQSEMYKNKKYYAAGRWYPETDLYGYPDTLVRARTNFAYQAGCQLLLNEKIKFGPKDKKIIKEFEKTAKAITKEIEKFRFYTASEKAYHYFWHTFCDKIIEEQKTRLYGQDKKEKLLSQHLLIFVLNGCLKILHPFMPFITEQIYQHLPIKNKKECLMVEEWPSK